MKHPARYDTDIATSARMAKVKLKYGDAERLLAKALWHDGYRYRLNYKQLPGSPDIVLTKYHIAIFIDGEFWHGHDWENKKPRLKRNREYWISKIEENMARDRRVDKELIVLGWTPIHFWTKDIKRNLPGCIDAIRELILLNDIERFDTLNSECE